MSLTGTTVTVGIPMDPVPILRVQIFSSAVSDSADVMGHSLLLWGPESGGINVESNLGDSEFCALRFRPIGFIAVRD